MANSFNAVVFTGNLRLGNKGFIKYRKINNQRRFRKFVESKFPDWRFINWYDRYTGSRIFTERRN